MKTIVFLVLLIVACMGQSCVRTADEKMRKETISVTIEPLRYFTEAIAGDRFSVVSMVPKGASPETYDPTPRQLISLGKSKAYFRIGYIGFEQTWMERLTANAPGMEVFDLSEGIGLIHEESESHDGHSHGGVEPHIWNSPANALVIVGNIYKALCRLDSVGMPYYAQRLDSMENVIRGIDSEIRAHLSGMPCAFMIYHPALTYFARDYGLRQIPIEQGGKSPSSAYLKSLIDVGREENVRIVFVQPEFDARNAEIIAGQVNARIAPIHPLAYEWTEEMLGVARILQNECQCK